MAPIEIKNGDSIELCTGLPEVSMPIECPLFSCMGNVWNFKFYLFPHDNYSQYYRALVDKTNNTPLEKPFKIDVEVGVTHDDNLILGKKILSVTLNSFNSLWDCAENSLKKKLPQDYRTGIVLKFSMRFHLPVGPLIKVDSKSHDMCLQTGSYLSSDTSVESLCEDYSKLFDTGEDHDIEIKCGEHTINAHKIILCARSKVFKRMLQSDMLEGQTGVVNIPDMDVNYLRDFVRYLYTGRLGELNFDKAKSLYEAGDKYDVKSIMVRCSEYLQDTLCRENAFECFELADAHSDEKLKERFAEYILAEKIYLQEDIWHPFCENYPRTANEIYRLTHKDVSESKRLKFFL